MAGDAHVRRAMPRSSSDGNACLNAHSRPGLAIILTMGLAPRIDYAELAVECAATHGTWDAFVRNALLDRWLADYARVSDWQVHPLEIEQGALTFLFDAGPTLIEKRLSNGEDRVVAVWGYSTAASRARDRRRLAGFLPDTRLWSGAQRDRGHFVAHAAGGGTDLNLFPQAIGLNRGRTAHGKRWREMEIYAARHTGTPLLIRPIYDTVSWTPAELDFAILTAQGLRWERLANRD